MSEAGKQIIRSRTKSFRDIYVAPVTQNDATAYAAGTPVKLARAISGKVSDKFSVEKIYSDDGVEDTVETYEGTDVEFEVNSLAPQDKAMLFGHLYKNGWLVKNKDDKAPEVAVGYRAKKLNGKYEFVWLYVGTFGQGYDDNYQTQEDKVTTQTATLKGSFYERACDENFETQVDESNLLTEHTDAAAAIKNWFGKVQEPTEAA
jgi:phi13 family phage major tail protein